MITVDQKMAAAKGADNLNLIRLLLAVMVIFSHAWQMTLGDYDNHDPLMIWSHCTTFGHMAVDGFFFISGFLITGSWLRSNSPVDYAKNRILRIYPGYIAMMAFCAVLIWVVCPEFKQFITSQHQTGQWIQSVGKDAIRLGGDSICDKHAFMNNPCGGLTNGPIWTIPLEFKCYIAVLILGLLTILRRRLWVLIIAALGYQFCTMMLLDENDYYSPLYLSFACGAAAWTWKEKIPHSGRLAATALAILVATSHFKPWLAILSPLLFGYCLLWLAYAPTLPLAKWANKTDLSYGTYLYGCPVQQVLAISPALRIPLLNFGLAIPLTLALAWLSWTVVEKPCLSLKKFRFKRSSAPLPAPQGEPAG